LTTASGQVHVDREPGAVARRQVAVAVGRDALAVELGARRSAAVRQDGDRAGAVDAVAGARRDVAEEGGAKRAGPLGRDAAAGAVGERQALMWPRAADLDLLDAAADLQRGGRRGGRKQAGERGENGGGSEADPRTLSWERGSSLSLPHRDSVWQRKT
jgi:hypothetical protein